MKVGDLVRYRDRRLSDPHPSDAGEYGAWGNVGVVVKVFKAEWGTKHIFKPSIEYVDFYGDRVMCKQIDVEVINGRKD
jgi:hypothetical protein